MNNDLPGVMLLGAAEKYRARYGVRVGENLVLFGNHDRLYASAARFAAAGMRVRAIIDTRVESAESASSQAARDELHRDGVECLMGHAVLAARGRPEVRGSEGRRSRESRSRAKHCLRCAPGERRLVARNSSRLA